MTSIDPSTIRAYADGELEAAEAEAVRAAVEADPDLAARVRFEQDLRQRVGSVMSEAPSAPAGLREQILAPAPVASITPEGRSWLAGPTRANFAAVAAVLVLVTGAIMLGIFGPQIDRLGIESPAEQLVGDTALYVDGEHINCASDPAHRERKLGWTERAEASEALGMHLGGCRVEVPDLTELGFDFVGCGPCALPGPTTSGHLLYVRDDRTAAASIFVVAEQGQYGDGEIDSTVDAPGCSRLVFQGSDGDVHYFVCCCDDADFERLVEGLRQVLRVR